MRRYLEGSITSDTLRGSSPTCKKAFDFGNKNVFNPSTFEPRPIEKGGDWGRRNRLKVYRGLHLLSIQQFKRGGELLLDALSMFTSTGLASCNDFVALTVISNTLTLTYRTHRQIVVLRLFQIFSIKTLTGVNVNGVSGVGG